MVMQGVVKYGTFDAMIRTPRGCTWSLCAAKEREADQCLRPKIAGLVVGCKDVAKRCTRNDFDEWPEMLLPTLQMSGLEGLSRLTKKGCQEGLCSCRK